MVPSVGHIRARWCNAHGAESKPNGKSGRNSFSVDWRDKIDRCTLGRGGTEIGRHCDKRDEEQGAAQQCFQGFNSGW